MLSIFASTKYTGKLAVILSLVSASSANAIDIPGGADSGQAAKRFERPSSALSAPDLNLPVPSDVGELSAAAKKQLEENRFRLKIHSKFRKCLFL